MVAPGGNRRGRMTEVLLHCSLLQEEIREALVEPGVQRVANGSGKLAGPADDLPRPLMRDDPGNNLREARSMGPWGVSA